MPQSKTPQRKTASRKPMQRQDKIIGYSVLILGIVALLGAGLMAARRYGHGPALIRDIGIAQAVEGDWQTNLATYHVIFQTHGGTYQILAVPVRTGDARLYSRGTAALNNNRMTLTPDPAMGAPTSDNPAIVYRNLTFGVYTIELHRQGADMLWLVGPRDPNRNDDPAHPLIQYSGKDRLLWTPKT